jgi:hypothetical protein
MVNNIIDASNLEKVLYKDVIKINLNTELRSLPPKGKTHAIKCLHSGNLLYFCSNEYSIKKNVDIYKPFEELLINSDINFYKRVQIINDTKFYINYILDIILVCAPCNFNPVVSIWNSYDGTIKTQLQCGYQNLKLPWANILTRPNYNSPDKNSNISAEQFFKLTKKFISNINHDLIVFEKLSLINTHITTFKKIATNLKFSKETKELAANQIKINDNDRNVTSLFNTYIALNYAIYNTNKKELPEIKLKKDKAVMNQILSLL